MTGRLRCRLPKDQRGWALTVWNRAERPQLAVDVAENWLRVDSATNEQLRYELTAAYLALGRKQDARRAETTDTPPPPPVQNNGRRQGSGFF